MNVCLLTRVRRTIARDPDRFCAAQWAFARNAEQVLRHGTRPDGFRCCIAGHVLLEADVLSQRELLREGGFHTGGGVWAWAARVAALSDNQARILFFPSQWDRPYKQQYYLCDRDEEAALAAAYLEYFVDEYAPAGRFRGAETTTGGSKTDRPPLPTDRSRRARSSQPTRTPA